MYCVQHCIMYTAKSNTALCMYFSLVFVILLIASFRSFYALSAEFFCIIGAFHTLHHSLLCTKKQSWKAFSLALLVSLFSSTPSNVQAPTSAHLVAASSFAKPSAFGNSFIRRRAQYNICSDSFGLFFFFIVKLELIFTRLDIKFFTSDYFLWWIIFAWRKAFMQKETQ